MHPTTSAARQVPKLPPLKRERRTISCSSDDGRDVIVRAKQYPQLRFMGSKHRLLPWIHAVLKELKFHTALDAFSGSGCVSYLMKVMGKSVTANDFLNFCSLIAKAAIENSNARLEEHTIQELISIDNKHERFIERTFKGIFFTPDDLRFLDQISWNIKKLADPYHKALALASLTRACLKRQPRGVFTVAGDPNHYKDGRRDLKLSLQEHFIEHARLYNQIVFDNFEHNQARKGSIFEESIGKFDLVYLDPPYVPRSDDNCYMKRYHFLEGLSCYWKNLEIMGDSKVKKVKKPFTPFSYRRTAGEAFDSVFSRFRESIIVLSYSSNGYPDLKELCRLMKRYKKTVEIHETAHRYHFGTHKGVARSKVKEYLIVGT